jgi:hypothetical protein
MRRLLLSMVLLASWSAVAFAQTSPASEIAPGGKLRVGMIALTVLGGVAEPVARFIGEKIGATVEPVIYPAPGAYQQSFGKGEWDIAHRPSRSCPGRQGGLDAGPLGRQPCLRCRSGKGVSRYCLR